MSSLGLNYDMLRLILYNLPVIGILNMSSVNHYCYNMVFNDHTTEMFVKEMMSEQLEKLTCYMSYECPISLCLEFDVDMSLKVIYCLESSPYGDRTEPFHFERFIVANNLLDLYV